MTEVKHFLWVADLQPNRDSSHNSRDKQKALADFPAKTLENSRPSFIVAAGRRRNPR
jgi:hypothetical protein